MKPRITLKKIAKEFGVSISTVSKALKDSHEISEETRGKIKAFADYYNYKPNSLALQLRNQKTSVIGVIIPEIVHHFFSTVIQGIEQYANSKGYSVMVCLSNESYEKEVSNFSVLTNGSVDGLIVSIARETQENQMYNHFNALIKDDFPLVLFDRIIDDVQCDKVIIDDIGGAFKATNHLAEIGAKRIALITTQDYITVGSLRKEGYLKSLITNKIVVDENLIYKINDNEDLYEQIEKIINVPNPPDAILAVNEIYAAIALKIAKKRGFLIPSDIAIIGFTSGLISEFTDPSLTSVEQHGDLMGRQAAELLIDRIENTAPKEFQKEVISPNLKIRESTLSMS
ncbi:MAG: LacI family DNA-binding transcriptional regulator [Lutibacter sp.]|uniref:LacI family DNA-binding transcriptional regulator n=1 Tax=Lutibacter sp. TaxID=1925666 RepID=UPI00181BDBBD|nr:LacI family DNA-binding transcriptional regulator [Lutibacter sp.]MBT8316592.1 LacI family transcriptional regulator [Lutibacter sp.]NNJ57452.1 LacI family DNA-binding transcriptional regulator [Lutibacter sp.]